MCMYNTSEKHPRMGYAFEWDGVPFFVLMSRRCGGEKGHACSPGKLS